MALRITVIGTGYLGLTHAACMAELGFDVLGIDTDEAKIHGLREGKVPFYEPELDRLVATHVASGRLRFTTSFHEIADFGDVHFSCVGTPQRNDGLAADLSQVDSVVEKLGPLLRRPCLLVGKSTVPVGTAERLAKRLTELAPAGSDAELAWNPEFLREGFAVADTLRPDRLVAGVQSDRAVALLREVYRAQIQAGVPFLTMDFATAELVKVAANAFLATKISFINAIADVCDAAGADVSLLADAIGHDPRIGRRFLNAGLGFGGGCLPKDIRAFMARAEELGVGESLALLREVDAMNLSRRDKVVERVATMCGGDLTGRRLAVLGAAFKPDSDDVRDSPALATAHALQICGADVRVHDPKAIDRARALYPTLRYATSVVEACEGADLVLHLTEWAEYRQLDPQGLRTLVARPAVLDARNALDADLWRNAGWQYVGLGRAAPAPAARLPSPRQPVGSTEVTAIA
ncbi:MAG: UDP-glucose dehydrogenase family protein [Sporichthyaceae bacterium]